MDYDALGKVAEIYFCGWLDNWLVTSTEPSKNVSSLAMKQ